VLEKKNNNWIADNWDEMGFDLGKKRYRGGDMKIKCIACEESGGADRGSTDASINPDSGIGHCFKCGTAFLIRKQEQVNKKEVKPIVLKNRTLLSKEGLDLLKSRRITQEAINRHKLVETNKMIVFPFFYNGQFVNAKMRGIAEKHFMQTPGGYHIVYNYDNCTHSYRRIIFEVHLNNIALLRYRLQMLHLKHCVVVWRIFDAIRLDIKTKVEPLPHGVPAQHRVELITNL